MRLFQQTLQLVREAHFVTRQLVLAPRHRGPEGLNEIYGFADSLPTSVSVTFNGQAVDPGCYDDCLVWVRNSIAYLVKFNQVDQRYSFPISINERLGETAYKAGRKLRDLGDLDR